MWLATLNPYLGCEPGSIGGVGKWLLENGDEQAQLPRQLTESEEVREQVEILAFMQENGVSGQRAVCNADLAEDRQAGFGAGAGPQGSCLRAVVRTCPA